MNVTIVPTETFIPIPVPIILCTVALVLAAIVLFGGIRKAGCCYLTSNSLLLSLYAKCCCCCPQYTHRVRSRGTELNELLEEINDV